MIKCKCPNCCTSFLEQTTEPAETEATRQRYCQSQYYTRCARYTVLRTLGRGQVPAHLHPSELAMAHQIIARAAVGIS